jgi:hypothetical protein
MKRTPMLDAKDGDLYFDFPEADSQEPFDDEATFGTTTIQPVDFIVDIDERYVFIEVKDHDNPVAKNQQAILAKLRDGRLIRKLAGKYRDSRFFFEFQQRSPKPVHYVVVLSWAAVDNALLLAKTEELKLAIPISHASHRLSCLDQCIILNLEQFKKRFGDGCVWRKSEYEK